MPYNSVILDPIVCDATVFRKLVLCFVLSTGIVQLTLLLIVAQCSLCYIWHCRVLLFPLSQVKSHQAFFGSLPSNCRWGRCSTTCIQFWSWWFTSNIYCSQDPFARAGECSVEALHYRSWWVLKPECKTWSILSYGGTFLIYLEFKPHWSKSLSNYRSPI